MVRLSWIIFLFWNFGFCGAEDFLWWVFVVLQFYVCIQISYNVLFAQLPAGFFGRLSEASVVFRCTLTKFCASAGHFFEDGSIEFCCCFLRLSRTRSRLIGKLSDILKWFRKKIITYGVFHRLLCKFLVWLKRAYGHCRTCCRISYRACPSARWAFWAPLLV